MKSPTSSILSLLCFLAVPLSSAYAASDSGSKDALSPCVARSPTSGLYYDLNAISLSPPNSDHEKSRKTTRDESWHAKGHDYPANFTLNVCAPVVENITDVVGVEPERWQNVSAYYTKEGNIYSIGRVHHRNGADTYRQQASEPFFRGRKLVLNYTEGSPCAGEFIGNGSRTKSTIMSFLCDRDAQGSQAIPSFVGTMDECTYFFEVRSAAACGGIARAGGEGLGPGGVFGVIALIAVAAYLIGGCAYQRTVMHQRGWRQCPNFSLWAGMLDFVKDMVVILFSSLGRLLSCRRSPALGQRSNGSLHRGRRSSMDAENRLIDQLDEQWED